DLLRILLEGVFAAAATNVISLALVADGDFAESAGDHAYDFLLLSAEALAFLGASHLEIGIEDGPLRRLAIEAIDEPGPLGGQVHFDPLGLFLVGIGSLQNQEIIFQLAQEYKLLVVLSDGFQLILPFVGQIAQLAALKMLAVVNGHYQPASVAFHAPLPASGFSPQFFVGG